MYEQLNLFNSNKVQIFFWLARNWWMHKVVTFSQFIAYEVLIIFICSLLFKLNFDKHYGLLFYTILSLYCPFVAWNISISIENFLDFCQRVFRISNHHSKNYMWYCHSWKMMVWSSKILLTILTFSLPDSFSIDAVIWINLDQK